MNRKGGAPVPTKSGGAPVLTKEESKSSKKLSDTDLINMAKESDKRALEIEDTYKANLEKIKKEYSGKELAINLAKEERVYYGKKSDNDRKTKQEIECVQRTLLDEIKSQYEYEQKKIMKEYSIFEIKAKQTCYGKEIENNREYKQSIDQLVSKYNKKLYSIIRNHKDNDPSCCIKKACDVKQIPKFETPTIESILKTATISGCDHLNKLDAEYCTTKKTLSKEYKKTKDSWKIESQIYDSEKELDSEYNSRCTRYRYKYNIERFEHINKCTECKTTKFSYIPFINTKNKNVVADPLLLYFHKHIKPCNLVCGDNCIKEHWCQDCNVPIIEPCECKEGYQLQSEFAKQFIEIFINFYNNEIDRIRIFEVSVPKEQNLIFTVLYAEKIWTKVKSRKVLDLNYNQKDEDAKITEFKKDEEKFYKDFPIVARYMLCADTYNRIAFKKFLAKLILNNAKKTQREQSGVSKEGDAENAWIELQADYVKYLYQECHKTKHLSTAEMRHVWKETYELLKKEFGDFRELYDKKVKQIEEEKNTHTAQVAKDLIGRLTTIQSIDNETQYKLYIEMQNTLFLQRASKNMKALLAVRQPIVIGLEGKGQNKEAAQILDRDKKLKDAKNKFEPEAQVKNPVKYYYDNLEEDDDKHIFTGLRDLDYLYRYHDVQHDLAHYLRRNRKNYIEFVGDGSNMELLPKWEAERKKWIDERQHMENPEIKIHIPYTRNLVKMYYDNDCKFEVN